MKEIDDYDLYDLDFNEWARRGRVAFGLEEDIGRDWETSLHDEAGEDGRSIRLV